jgi:hypothetical protein
MGTAEEQNFTWLIEIPNSVIRDEPLFYATKDQQRAEGLVAELTAEHGKPVTALKVWLEGSMETWGPVTRWEHIA